MTISPAWYYLYHGDHSGSHRITVNGNRESSYEQKDNDNTSCTK